MKCFSSQGAGELIEMTCSCRFLKILREMCERDSFDVNFRSNAELGVQRQIAVSMFEHGTAIFR